VITNTTPRVRVTHVPTGVAAEVELTRRRSPYRARLIARRQLASRLAAGDPPTGIVRTYEADASGRVADPLNEGWL
jgi:protein subunit release factor A